MSSNFNDTVPAAPAGSTNVSWQTDGSGNDSAYVPTSILTPSNVSIVSLVAGDVLVWNGSIWVNAPIPDPDPAPTVNVQTASYPAVLGDANNIVEMNVAGANNFTVPTNASVAFAIGTTLTVIQYGAGQTTLVAAGGVTIHTPSSLTARARYSTVCVIKVATDTWVAAGDLT